MAEKNDDIKNLFMNLGLNPSDYHEIRTAPSANATVSEAPRRWSLLQAAAAKPVASPAPLAKLVPAPGVAAAPAQMPASAPAGELGGVGSLSAALLAAAQDIARAETRAETRPAAAATPTPAASIVPAAASALPSALADAFVQAAPVDGLQSLFQSVKEPQTVAQPRDEPARPTERRTDQLLASAPVMTPTQRAATLPAPPAIATLQALTPSDEEPVTRHAPPTPSRLGPVPTPVAAAPVPAASGRLRFGSSMAETAPVHGESLRDVFRRLSRDNRP